MKLRMTLMGLAILAVTATLTMTVYSAAAKRSQNFKVDDVKKEQTMYVYQFRSYAWGYQDYAYLFSPDGDVVYVDINKEKGKDFPIGKKKTLQFFDEYKEKQEDAMHMSVKRASNSLIQKGINLKSIKLEEAKGRRVDGGSQYYYCVKGTGKSRKLVLLEEAGENPRKTKDKNALRVVKYMKKALKEAREQERLEEDT